MYGVGTAAGGQTGFLPFLQALRHLSQNAEK